MPTLDALTTSVYRDLADEAKEVFSVLQIEDFIRHGVAELNRIAPQETTENLVLVVDEDTGKVVQQTYATIIELPYTVSVNWIDGSGQTMIIPEAEPGYSHSSGFTFRRSTTGGVIVLPIWVTAYLDASIHAVRIDGYTSRPIPYGSATNVAVSDEEEYLVRAYAKSQGYDLLSHDRSMFAQWQGQTNNTDVSPTQLMQMAVQAAQGWDRMRGLNRIVRRYW
jgi:hypothetical protein